jgi:hypothetical protein
VRGVKPIGHVCLAIALAAAAGVVGCRRGNQPGGPASTTTAAVSTTTPAVSTTIPAGSRSGGLGSQTVGVKLVPIQIELPAPAFRGTPVPRKEPNVEEPRLKPRPPFLAPEGTVNLARGKSVACSETAPVSGELDFVTDGDKEASDFGYLELRPGTQWVQVDLGQRAAIYAVLVWHSHAEARVYRDVIVQVSDDPDFLEAQTVFNNDYDNSSGMGIGSNQGYVETSEGKLIDCQGVEGRYVRLYSKGNHIDDKNHYTEVEVFGLASERG